MVGRALTAPLAAALIGAALAAATTGRAAPRDRRGTTSIRGTGYHLTLPPHLAPLPALVGGAADDPGAERRGFGDPASGCYALVQSIEVDDQAGLAELHAALGAALGVAGLADRGAGAAPAAGAGRVVSPLGGHGIEGHLTSQLAPTAGGKLRVVSLACFHDDREPAWCESVCAALDAGLEVHR